jgi:hypothetical protein
MIINQINENHSKFKYVDDLLQTIIQHRSNYVIPLIISKVFYIITIDA